MNDLSDAANRKRETDDLIRQSALHQLSQQKKRDVFAEFARVEEENKYVDTMHAIRRARIMHNLTQQQVADMGGVALRTYARYESGQRAMPKPVSRLLEIELELSK